MSVEEHLERRFWDRWRETDFGAGFSSIRFAEQDIGGVPPQLYPDSLHRQIVFAGTGRLLSQNRFIQTIVPLVHEHCRIPIARGEAENRYYRAIEDLARRFFGRPGAEDLPAWLFIVPRRKAFEQRWHDSRVFAFQEKPKGDARSVHGRAKRHAIDLYHLLQDFQFDHVVPWRDPSVTGHEAWLYRVNVTRTFTFLNLRSHYLEEWWYLSDIGDRTPEALAQVPASSLFYDTHHNIVQTPIVNFCRLDRDDYLHHVSYEMDPFEGLWSSFKSASLPFWASLLSDPNNHWMLWKTVKS